MVRCCICGNRLDLVSENNSEGDIIACGYCVSSLLDRVEALESFVKDIYVIPSTGVLRKGQ